MTRLGKAIRLYRLTQSIEQKALAAEIGITPSQLGRLENGRGDLDGIVLVRVMTWLTGEVQATNGAATDAPQQAALV